MRLEFSFWFLNMLLKLLFICLWFLEVDNVALVFIPELKFVLYKCSTAIYDLDIAEISNYS